MYLSCVSYTNPNSALYSLHHAELHGRAQPGIQDMLQALEGLRPLRASWTELREFAFPEMSGESAGGAGGASSTEVNAAVADLEGEDEEGGDEGPAGDGSSRRQGSAGWHQPFPHPVPQFPVRQRATGEDTSALIGEKAVRGAQVPEHLPAYPPRHTYKRSGADGARSSRKRAAAVAAREKEGQRVKREAMSSVSKSLAKIEDCADEQGEGNEGESR